MPETKITNAPKTWVKIRAMEYTKYKETGVAVTYRVRSYLRNDGVVSCEACLPDAPLPDVIEPPDTLEKCFGTDDILKFTNGGLRPRTEQEFDQEFLADLKEYGGKEILVAVQ